MKPAIELVKLGRRYGREFVLKDINLVVQAGRIVVLKGSNGAGKTTLLKVLATRLRPSKGTGQIFGHDLVKQAHEVRKSIAYLSVMGSNYPGLTALENLRLAADLYHYDATRAELEAKLDAVGLLAARQQLVRTFSSGMKKRLAIARLVLADADLLLLDEPYAVLDDEGKALIDTLLEAARQESRTVLMASHELYRSSLFADAVLELDQGYLKPVTAAQQVVAHG